MLASVTTLLSETIDYAGLFPPAKLSMREALTNYACYQMAFTHTMLGHFVLPASRLKELEEENHRLKRLVADEALDIQMRKYLSE